MPGVGVQLGLDLFGHGGHSVDTLKLRGIQHPSKVDRLLESYIAGADTLPKNACQIRTVVAVPTPLHGLVMQAIKLGKSWSCWTRGSTQTWLFTAEMSLPLSRKRGAPVLQVKLYGDDGLLRESGTVTTDQSGKWSRCAD
jgi:hypothetical protein